MWMRGVVIFIGLFVSQASNAVTLPGPVVESRWLAGNSRHVVILDVRNDTNSFTGQPVYKKDRKTKKMKFTKVGGHIPGAVLVNYRKVRVKRKIGGLTISKMAPTKAAFEKLLQQSGVNQNSTIIVVTKGESIGDVTIATRFYWQLKYFGHEKMAILNGGTAHWIKSGYLVHGIPKQVMPGNWRVKTENRNIIATSEDVAEAIKSSHIQLLDARDINQYLGTFSNPFVYAKGHIPGAKFFPVEIITTKKSPVRFNSIEDLHSLARALKVDTKQQTITYCNSGHLASGTWFVISEMMKNPKVKMYDGSMHQWTLEKRPTTKMKME